MRLEVPLRGNIIHWVYLWTDCWEKYLNLRDGQTKTGKLDGWMDLIDIIRASSAAHINKFWKELERCWPWSGRPRPTTLQPPRSNGKTRGCYCSCKLLIMGGEGTETCWATHKPQVINLWNCCILLVNPLKPKLNPICYLLALLAHHFLHVSRIRVKSLTIRLLMSYIYGAPIIDVSRSHTTTQHSR